MPNMHIPGVEIRNAAEDDAFSSRPVRPRDVQAERDAYLHMANLFLTHPGTLLQELVDISMNLCGADSAGISLMEGASFRWVATSGRFAPLLNSMLPVKVSPCGICLERNQPQLFSVGAAYYEFLDIPGPPFHNGILIPWLSGETKGTLWVIPRDDSPGFDSEDLRLLTSFAAMAALCVRINEQQQRLRQGDLFAAGARIANRLAHEINNPLQCLTNTLYLASQKHPEPYLNMALIELERLSGLVDQILRLPKMAEPVHGPLVEPETIF